MHITSVCIGRGSVLVLFGTTTFLTSCVLFPRNEFRAQYERELIGRSYRQTVEPSPYAKELVSTSPPDTRVFKVSAGRKCNVFYEVKSDTITRAWDDGGNGCAIFH